MKSVQGEFVTDVEEIRNLWRTYMEKLAKEETGWDQNTICGSKERRTDVSDS